MFQKKSLDKKLKFLSLSTKDLVILFCIFLTFFGMYYGFSSRLIQSTPIAKYDDVLFEIDTSRAIIDMTVFSGYHYRTEVHPIYVLLINPLGEILGRILPSNEKTAIFINSFFGAVSVSVAYLLFRIIQVKTIISLLAALFFGLSTSQFYLSIIPDTASFAVFTLLFSYALLLISFYYQKVPLGFWILAGILTLGVTTTNFAQTVICYFFALSIPEQKRTIVGKIGKTITYTFIVIAIVSMLALLQKWIYPSSTLFFLPEVYFGELSYASVSIFDEPLRIASMVLKNFFLDAVIAPGANTISIGDRAIPAITFANSSIYTPAGAISLMFWAAFSAMAIFPRMQKRQINTPDIALLGCVLVNLVLHSFYGIGEKGKIELFLYTGNVTSLTLTLLMVWFKENKSKSVLQAAVLLPLAVFTGINSIAVLTQIMDVFIAFR